MCSVVHCSSTSGVVRTSFPQHRGQAARAAERAVEAERAALAAEREQLAAQREELAADARNWAATKAAEQEQLAEKSGEPRAVGAFAKDDNSMQNRS